jgi:eukaryotic-like serine/threonine-protein kinase
VPGLVSDAPVTSAKRYVPIAKLGRGGMADVYLVFTQGAQGVNKLLVMKQLRPSLAEDPKLLTMFMNEARLSVRLSHPNVVQIYEVLRFDEGPALIMDYLEGVSLGELRRSAAKASAWKPSIGLSVLMEALTGLDYAHNLTDYDGTPLNIIHRDFTPQNIFVTFDGYVKVLDFGIAKAQNTSSQTKTGQLKGTLPYMAPEAMEGKVVDRTADIYSAGVILLEMLTGCRIWEGVTDVRIIRSVIEGELPSLSELMEDAPEELVHICSKATTKDPRQRYQSAAELRDAIRSYAVKHGSVPSQPEIGQMLLELFADRRERIRQRIHQQIEASSTTANGSSNGLDLPVLGIRSGVSLRTTAPLAEPLGPSRRTLAAIVVAILLASAGLGVFLQRQEENFRVDEIRPSFQDGGSQPPNRDVRVTVVAIPKDAKIEFRGEAMQSNPAVIQHPRDNSIREVIVSAPGFQSKIYQVPMIEDVNLSVTLDRLPVDDVEEPVPDHKEDAKASRTKEGAERGRHPAPKASKEPDRDLIRSSPWRTP